MNLQRYVDLCFVVAGLLLWIIAAAFFTFVIELINVDFNLHLLGSGFTLADLLGLLAGIGGGIYLRVNAMINTWAMEVATELSKVTWPTWPETKLGTIVVIVTSIIVALILGLFDYIWAFITSQIYGI